MRDAGFPSVRLGKACSLITDGSHFSPIPQVEGRPIVNAKDMPRGRINLSTCTRISEADWVLLSRQNCAPCVGDVLLSKDGTIGRVVHYRRDEGVVLLSSVAILRPDAGLDSEFLAQILRSHLFDAQLFRFQSGSALKRLVLGDIRKIEVPQPTLGTQQHIAEILSTVDDAIQQTEALIAKTQQIKAGLMHDLFTRGVTADGRLRPPREQAPHLYKESQMGWVPKVWEAGHLVDRRAGNRPHIKTGPFGSSLKLEHWVDRGVPVITIGALGEGEFIESQLLHVSLTTADRLHEYRLSEGDVVFSRVADVGRSAVITASERGWIMSSNLMRISLDSAQVVPSFLQAQLAYDSRVRAQIRATLNVGGREVANSAILNRLYFSWPAFSEQELIVSRLEAIEEQRRCAADDLAKFRHLKDGLMYDLLSGKVTPPINTAAEMMGVAANV
jgi:type I restriction enzyme S subunit